MNGVHDMGGMHGFGDVPDDDAQFHADWERTAYAMNKLLRLQGVYNIHEYRHSVERLEPATYLGASYFGRWFRGVEQLLRERDVLSEAEIERRAEAIRTGEYDPDGAAPRDAGGAGVDPAELAERAREAFERGVDRDGEPPDPAFEPGEDVRVRNVHPAGHTRIPRYARGETAAVTTVLGRFDLPDAAVEGEARAEPVYSVRFDAGDLWGEHTDADVVTLDMWESYLEPARTGPDG